MSKSPNEFSYEETIQKIEKNLYLLEQGKCSLQEAIKLYQETHILIRQCETYLQNIEQQIHIVDDEQDMDGAGETL